jgi:SPOR domain
MSDQFVTNGPMYRPSRDDDHGLDPGLIRAFMLAAGIGAAGLVLYGGYKLLHHGSSQIPVITADPKPLRLRPENPGGMRVAPEEAKGVAGETRLAPDTEEPDPRALTMRPDGSMGRGAPPPVRAAAVTVQLTTAKTEAAAQSAWDKLIAKQPGLFGGHRPLFLKTNDAGAASWRLRTGGFTDADQAKSFCEQVKAKGGTCTVSEP